MSKTSDAEKAAYTILIGMGYKVIRQQPISTGRKTYFADLYLPQLKTIIEIDGGYHNTRNQRRLDKNRSNGIWRLGFHVIRLSNRDARSPKKIAAKIEMIKKKVNG